LILVCTLYALLRRDIDIGGPLCYNV